MLPPFQPQILLMAVPADLSALALARFGLGPKPGERAALGGAARDALLGQLDRPEAALLEGPSLLPSDALYREHRATEERRRLERAANMGTSQKSQVPPFEENTYKGEAAARFARLVSTETPFLERLVLFWSNHFCVALSKGNQIRVIAGAFEREAIRPHILGRFADMVKAVEQHPAMLIYLDNNQSIGPNSRTGLNGRRGLNENLAREIMELHTLGVDGGYTQADVTSLARIITGWTITSPDDDATYGGRFTIAPNRHEPGDQVLLGRTFPAGGREQGEAALAFIAGHPSTARHIATKLASHFVADNPPDALVEKLSRAFIDSDGDLAAVSRTLLEAPESWDFGVRKIRMPVEFIVAAARLTGRPADPLALAGQLGPLGQPLWNPSGPNGFSDKEAFWASPEGMTTRLDIAARIGQQSGNADPMRLLREAFGPEVSAATREAVGRAESRQQAVALLLMSPEFQRR
jgi:uncharacterized protein (DUF1800 family)